MLEIGAIVAVGTLLVLDASLPDGLIAGSGDMRYAQTMTFTTLVLFSLFTVFNARSDQQSAFVGLFSDKWLWAAVGFSLVQATVTYVPLVRKPVSTTRLSAGDWLVCAGVGKLGAVAAGVEQARGAGQMARGCLNPLAI